MIIHGFVTHALSMYPLFDHPKEPCTAVRFHHLGDALRLRSLELREGCAQLRDGQLSDAPHAPLRWPASGDAAADVQTASLS